MMDKRTHCKSSKFALIAKATFSPSRSPAYEDTPPSRFYNDLHLYESRENERNDGLQLVMD